MGEDLAAANVNRSYSLAATSIAIFTFMLFLLYRSAIHAPVPAAQTSIEPFEVLAHLRTCSVCDESGSA
jgi:hypothetical protein